MTIWVGCDHGGYEMKLALLKVLEGMNIAYTDVGGHSTEIVRYPYYAAQVAGAVARGEADRGLLICRTGIGMSVIANKYKGVRAALCFNRTMGQLTREHNNSNVLCLGGDIVSQEEAEAILRVWLTTDYIAGRHEISLGLIAQAENQMMNDDYWAEAEENYQ